MCLIAFSYDDHPKYKLILAANRDAFYERPTRAAQFWNEKPDILAGKDLKAGGTWMGIHKDGRWGALTNYRDPSIKKENPPSRGELVLNYLGNNHSAIDFIRSIKSKSNAYNGFNLLLGDSSGIYHFSNQAHEITKAKPGIHGISNALLDTPWPKLTVAKAGLKEIISKADFSREELFELLKNDAKAVDEELPDTGIPYEWEKTVSAIFIKSQNYGTRCSTILLIDYEGKVEFTERRFIENTGEVSETNTYSFETA